MVSHICQLRADVGHPAFDEPFEIEAHSVRGGASCGIAVYPEDGLTKDELQRVADSAMYAKKSVGE